MTKRRQRVDTEVHSDSRTDVSQSGLETPGFALARYWAGHEREVAQLRGEIERMRKLVVRAAETLEKAGQEREGWRLKRALDGQ